MPMVGSFFKARKKLKPGVNYVLSLVYLVGWAHPNSKIHILSQGATVKVYYNKITIDDHFPRVIPVECLGNTTKKSIIIRRTSLA